MVDAQTSYSRTEPTLNLTTHSLRLGTPSWFPLLLYSLLSLRIIMIFEHWDISCADFAISYGHQEQMQWGHISKTCHFHFFSHLSWFYHVHNKYDLTNQFCFVNTLFHICYNKLHLACCLLFFLDIPLRHFPRATIYMLLWIWCFALDFHFCMDWGPFSLVLPCLNLLTCSSLFVPAFHGSCPVYSHSLQSIPTPHMVAFVQHLF